MNVTAIATTAIVIVALLGILLFATGNKNQNEQNPAGLTETRSTSDGSSQAPQNQAQQQMQQPPADSQVDASVASKNNKYSAPPAMTIDSTKTYTAVISTNKGDMTVELDAKGAPKTVNNFVFLAKEKFYDGVIFHRIIKGFMEQTGDPTGTGQGGPGYRFEDEPVTKDYTKGTLAMANAGPNTNGSQFFIMNADYQLPKNYTIFGKVTTGMETVDAVANTPVGPSAQGEMSKPTEKVEIKSVTIQEG